MFLARWLCQPSSTYCLKRHMNFFIQNILRNAKTFQKINHVSAFVTHEKKGNWDITNVLIDPKCLCLLTCCHYLYPKRLLEVFTFRPDYWRTFRCAILNVMEKFFALIILISLLYGFVFENSSSLNFKLSVFFLFVHLSSLRLSSFLFSSYLFVSFAVLLTIF